MKHIDEEKHRLREQNKKNKEEYYEGKTNYVNKLFKFVKD